MVAAGRQLRLGYFDHPPIAWWLAWAAAHLAGSDSPIVVRLPFIALFALTTWLMFRVTAALFGARAGLWAAVLANLCPVIGVTAGTWVLPDGPLFAALLGATLCLIAALPAQGRAAWGWWLGAGICAGLALSSKYSAGSDDPRRHRVSADRKGKPPLAVATASLCRRSRRAGGVHAGPDLECAARLGVVSVPGRSGGGSLQPARAGLDARRRCAIPPPWIWSPLMCAGSLRCAGALPTATLAARLPRGTANSRVHRGCVVG